MSIQAISWVFEHSRSKNNDRNVLMSIANHANSEGEDAWPAYETIAREANCDRATVSRCINNLREMGELDWTPGGGKEGRRRKSNRYWMPKMRLWITLTRSQSATTSNGQGRKSQSTRSQIRTDKVAPVRLEPSLTVQEPREPCSTNSETPRSTTAAKEACLATWREVVTRPPT